MFKPGDKVRFLNEAIEGEVVSVLGGDRVEVRDSYGFIHQAGRKDLVPVEFILSDEFTENVRETEVENKTYPVGNQQGNTPIVSATTRFIQFFEQDETIYGVLELLDPLRPLISDVEIWLVNTTELNASFVMSREKGELRSHPVIGQLMARSEFKIGIFSQDQLYAMDGLECQFIFYSTREYRPRYPLIKHMELRPGDLLEVASNRSGTLFDQTLKVPLVVLREENVDVAKLIKRFTEDEAEVRTSALKRKDKGKQKGGFTYLNRERVIDLHIEELLKEHSGLSAGQIIAHQLAVFEQEMDRAHIDHLNRITFIHGVGNGVLRSSIREALKRYDNITFVDAPAERFGGGATQIDFK